jgi:16S rRNA (guanine966-N2)-methyltransferase
MRVIAGSAGGIPLKTPDHEARPTMDRVREAIFSSLGDLVIGARVLDLFAGSGAFGIEALSRGAAEAVFVDNHPKAITTIQNNLRKTKLEGQVIRADAFRFLARNKERYQLVFADPPYAKRSDDRDFAAELLGSADLHAAVDGLLILERAPTKTNQLVGRWEVTRAKRYGATEVLFCVPSGHHAKTPKKDLTIRIQETGDRIQETGGF